MRPFLTAYFLLFATAFASPVFSADDEVIVLESAVQQNVASLAKSSVPKAIITRISSTREVLNKGNFGKSIHFDSKYMYSRREDGLWVIDGRRQAIYALKQMAVRDRHIEAERRRGER